MNEQKGIQRTPFYQALQSNRYARQEVISSIQKQIGRTLIVYEADIRSWGGSIGEEDIQPFGDLLCRISPGQDIDLLLHSPGGDIEAAEKIVYMCREVAKGFRTIVPEYAKSAATLITLASDELIMGLASELGPIDAQVLAPGPGSTPYQTSAQSFIDEFDQIKEDVGKTNELSPVYYPLLADLNLGFIRLCRNLMDRSKQFAEKWLKIYMFKDDPSKAKEVAEDLCNVKKWLTHGAVIDADEADKIGIKVNKLRQDDDLWKQIWYLHCCYGVLFRSTGAKKVFESETVSLVFE